MGSSDSQGISVLIDYLHTQIFLLKNLRRWSTRLYIWSRQPKEIFNLH